MSSYISTPYTPMRKSFVDPAPAWGIDKGDGAIFVRCGGCRKCIDLPHEIAADGTVSPSVICECGWHVHLQLQDYFNYLDRFKKEKA